VHIIFHFVRFSNFVILTRACSNGMSVKLREDFFLCYRSISSGTKNFLFHESAFSSNMHMKLLGHIDLDL
jgi:hypothetical protein